MRYRHHVLYVKSLEQFLFSRANFQKLHALKKHKHFSSPSIWTACQWSVKIVDRLSRLNCNFNTSSYYWKYESAHQNAYAIFKTISTPHGYSMGHFRACSLCGQITHLKLDFKPDNNVQQYFELSFTFSLFGNNYSTQDLGNKCGCQLQCTLILLQKMRGRESAC